MERRIAPRLESAVQTPGFAVVVAAAVHARARARRFLERRTSGVWHLVNLPAGSDLARVREQLGALDHEVRRLAAAVEDARFDLGPPPKAGRRDPGPAAEVGRPRGADAEPKPARGRDASRREQEERRDAPVAESAAQPARPARAGSARGRAQRAART